MKHVESVVDLKRIPACHEDLGRHHVGLEISIRLVIPFGIAMELGGKKAQIGPDRIAQLPCTFSKSLRKLKQYRVRSHADQEVQ